MKAIPHVDTSNHSAVPLQPFAKNSRHIFQEVLDAVKTRFHDDEVSVWKQWDVDHIPQNDDAVDYVTDNPNALRLPLFEELFSSKELNFNECQKVVWERSISNTIKGSLITGCSVCNSRNVSRETPRLHTDGTPFVPNNPNKKKRKRRAKKGNSNNCSLSNANSSPMDCSADAEIVMNDDDDDDDGKSGDATSSLKPNQQRKKRKVEKRTTSATSIVHRRRQQQTFKTGSSKKKGYHKKKKNLNNDDDDDEYNDDDNDDDDVFDDDIMDDDDHRHRNGKRKKNNINAYNNERDEADDDDDDEDDEFITDDEVAATLNNKNEHENQSDDNEKYFDDSELPKMKHDVDHPVDIAEASDDDETLPGNMFLRKTKFGSKENIAYIKRKFTIIDKSRAMVTFELPDVIPENRKMVVDSIVSPKNDRNMYLFRVFDASSRRQPTDPTKYFYIKTDVLTKLPVPSVINWDSCNSVSGFYSYSLYGRVVRKFFPPNGKTTGGWFWGEVELYNPAKGLYKVSYEDSDWEHLTEEELLDVLRSEWNYKRPASSK
jgi:hypothetical protein